MTSGRTASMIECPDLAEKADPKYYNEDIAPTTIERRNWDKWHIAALWVGMSVCVPAYQLASNQVQNGMSCAQAIGTVFLANLIVLIPMIMNAHAGTKFGIPFPVYCRTAFGLVGANIPAVMRGLVACGWFGIQTWIGGSALYQLLAALAPSVRNAQNLGFVDRNPWEFACFLLFWCVNIAIVWRGIDSIQFLEKWGAPFLILIGAVLLGWAYLKADGFGPMLTQPSKLTNWSDFMKVFAPALTANVSFWATLSLNIPDFTRFAKSQKDQILGQTLGLPPTMTAVAFVGVAVTSATVLIYGEPIGDPVALLGRIGEGKPLVVFLSMAALTIATLTTNLAANVVSPANDFSHLAPKYISFRTGGIITGIIGILICPWKLLEGDVYIFSWLGGYGSLLGSIGGILLVEYWLIQKTDLDLEDLYRPGGKYPLVRPWAILAFFLGAAPCVPGFIHTVNPEFAIPPVLETIYGYSIFVSAISAALLHLIFSWGRRGK